MAFVVVLHLPSSHPSNLSSILARTTSLDVVEVSDGERIQPNRVFVIPAGCCLALCGNQFRLTPRDKEVPPTPHVIDQFFHSLAEQCGPQSAGVILSGTGVDGTAGLSSIKAVGGITFAQNSSAVHGGMPGSAVATGVVDFVLPPDGLSIRFNYIDFIGEEARLLNFKLPAVKAYVRANKLNQVLWREAAGVKPKLGIASAGKAYADTRQALADLGIDQKMAADLGIRLYKIAVTWPLEETGVRDFAQGLDEIFVVEEIFNSISTCKFSSFKKVKVFPNIT